MGPQASPTRKESKEGTSSWSPLPHCATSESESRALESTASEPGPARPSSDILFIKGQQEAQVCHPRTHEKKRLALKESYFCKNNSTILTILSAIHWTFELCRPTSTWPFESLIPAAPTYSKDMRHRQCCGCPK